MAEEDEALASEKVSLLKEERARQANLPRWTCDLCAQTRNTVDMEKCKTCNRPRGHKADKYRERLNELRSLEHQFHPDQDYPYYDEGSSWSDYWGLIVGLILLFAIVALLAWAAYEDSKDAAGFDRDQGVEL